MALIAVAKSATNGLRAAAAAAIEESADSVVPKVLAAADFLDFFSGAASGAAAETGFDSTVNDFEGATTLFDFEEALTILCKYTV
jgi:hypothetical protein